MSSLVSTYPPARRRTAAASMVKAGAGLGDEPSAEGMEIDTGMGKAVRFLGSSPRHPQTRREAMEPETTP